MNAAFIEGGEKDDINIFIDAMTCDPRPAETYKLERHNWTLSHGAGATVYQVKPFPTPFAAASLTSFPKVPAEEFSLYHIVGTTDSTSTSPLNGPSIAIVTSVPSSGGHVTDKTTGTSVDVKKGQVYFVGAGTEVEYGPGVEVWAAFYDDQNREQTGDMK